jgi:hypothetical protein
MHASYDIVKKKVEEQRRRAKNHDHLQPIMTFVFLVLVCFQR